MLQGWTQEAPQCDSILTCLSMGSGNSKEYFLSTHFLGSETEIRVVPTSYSTGFIRNNRQVASNTPKLAWISAVLLSFPPNPPKSSDRQYIKPTKMKTKDVNINLDFQTWKDGQIARAESLDTPFNIYRRRQTNRLTRHLEYKQAKVDQSLRLKHLVYNRLSKACNCSHCHVKERQRTPPP